IELLARLARLEKDRNDDRFTSDILDYYRRLDPSQPSQMDYVLQAKSQFKEGKALYNADDLEGAKALFSNSRQLFLKAGDVCEASYSESWMFFCSLRMKDAYLHLQAIERSIRLYERKSYKSLRAEAISARADAHSSKDENEAIVKDSEASYLIAREIG